jgi:Family of unknown function (DUF6622)
LVQSIVSRSPAVIIRILSHTPGYVFALLAALIVFGLLQTRTREVSRGRALVLPAVLMVLSLSAVVGSFTQPLLAMAAWVAGFGAALLLVAPVMPVRQALWSPATRRFRLPGSWLPLALIVSLFLIKYTAGVLLALRPSFSSDVGVILSLSALYGAFAGLFWGRARSLMALTRADQVSGQTA